MLTPLGSDGWPGTGTMPRLNGTDPSWAELYTGGASEVSRYRQGANRGLQGLHPVAAMRARPKRRMG